MRSAGFVALCLFLTTCGEEPRLVAAPLTREAAIDLLLSPAGPGERAPVLIGGLADEDPVVAMACRAGLVAMGREAAPYLIHAIREAWLERGDAPNVVIHYPGDRQTLVVEAAGILAKACMYGAFTEREVVEYLIGDGYSEDQLLSLMRYESVPHPDEFVADLGILLDAQASSPMEEPDPASFPAMELDEAIRAFHDLECFAAARAAVRLRGREALPRLLEFITTGTPAEREAAAEGLDLGAVQGRDLSLEHLVTRLMWLLGQEYASTRFQPACQSSDVP